MNFLWILKVKNVYNIFSNTTGSFHLKSLTQIAPTSAPFWTCLHRFQTGT